MHDLVLFSVLSPILLGVYKDKQIISYISINGQVSFILPLVFSIIFNKGSKTNISHLESKISDFHLNNKQYNDINFLFKELDSVQIDYSSTICYCRGSGSLMAIKLTHIFLQTIKIIRDINLKATNLFYFTDLEEVKAFGNMSFFKKNNSIILDKSINPLTENPLTENFFLPSILKLDDFTEEIKPLYLTPAV